MATHSSILAWRIQSRGSQRVGLNWVTNTQHACLQDGKLVEPPSGS